MSTTELEALLAKGEEQGCITFSELEQLELEEAERAALDDQLAERRIEVSDDCGREAEPARYTNGELSQATTDALQLFMNEARRHPLLTKEPPPAPSRAGRAAGNARGD